MPHACPWHDGTTKWRKQDSTHLMLSQPPSMSIMMKYSTSTTTVHQMRSLNHSTLKSNSSERISGELLTRSFSYSVLLNCMPIPTKNLLTRKTPIPYRKTPVSDRTKKEGRLTAHCRKRPSCEKRRLPTLPHCIAVPSAMTGLTSLFGMGRGGTPSLSPP